MAAKSSCCSPLVRSDRLNCFLLLKLSLEDRKEMKSLKLVMLVCCFAVVFGCTAEDVKVDRQRTAEDDAYLKQVDDQVAAEEQSPQ